jgi:hypothetical protein
MPEGLPIDLGCFRVFPDSGHHARFFPLLAAEPSFMDDELYERMGLEERVKHLTEDVRTRLREICKFKFRTFFSGLYTILASGVTGAAGKN